MLKNALKILDPENKEDLLDNTYEVGEFIEGKTKNIEFYAISDYYYYFGRSWCDIDDDETGRQFKDSVEKEVKALFGEDVKIETYEEAWYDG